MNEIRAFFTLPEKKDDCPNILNAIGNISLIPVIYLTRSSEIQKKYDVNDKLYSELKPFGKITLMWAALSALLFIPSLILGVLFKGISYVDPAVREQHKSFRELHDQKKPISSIEIVLNRS